ncbi:hypothetical protein NDU88_009791 [Pleurodeles waltl]|uniref:Secreted protein n=1 Tax=Pleurodeles waltl TaxID=8319 RepID=A0AAV7PW74_PLEWA|nr:hypothetical protein NDU88_009791 [Pleurodeles waltl]
MLWLLAVWSVFTPDLYSETFLGLLWSFRKLCLPSHLAVRYVTYCSLASFEGWRRTLCVPLWSPWLCAAHGGPVQTRCVMKARVARGNHHIVLITDGPSAVRANVGE